MTSVPLSDEQADRIEAGEQPPVIGVSDEVATGPVTFTRPCPECHGRGLADVRGAPPCLACGDGRQRGTGWVPVTVRCPERCFPPGSHITGWSGHDTYEDCQSCHENLDSWGRIPVEASVVHVIPTADVVLGAATHMKDGVVFVAATDRWWVGDAPWVLLLEWEGDGR